MILLMLIMTVDSFKDSYDSDLDIVNNASSNPSPNNKNDNAQQSQSQNNNNNNNDTNSNSTNAQLHQSPSQRRLQKIYQQSPIKEENNDNSFDAKAN